MKKKALTKRQVLNELLVIKEKKVKYEETLARVYSRGERLDDRYNQLKAELEVGLDKEIRKDGLNPYNTLPEPILYKGHVFALIKGKWDCRERVLEINSVKAVK